MSLLFTTIDRIDLDPKGNAESDYSFINRSARPAIGQLRDVIESWLVDYPEPDVNELVNRMRSTEFDSAYFELLLHTYFVRAGMSVTIHPRMVGTGRRPDFLVRDGDSEFIVEALTKGDVSDEARGRLNVIARLYDSIDDLASPGYYLHLKECEIALKSQPSEKQVRKFIKGENERISLMASTEIESYEAEYRDENVRIVLGAFATSVAKAKTKPARSIGIYPTACTWGNEDQLIKKAIENKAKNYGEPSVPYVIAVNCVSQMGPDEVDIVNALYGTEVQHCKDGRIVGVSRKGDGVFHNATTPINRQVSAVLIARVLPWNLDKALFKLYLNPWATHRFDPGNLKIRVAEAVGDELQYRGETNLLATFCLPVGWPELPAHTAEMALYP